MSKPFYAQNQVILAAIETIYGTLALQSDAKAMLVSNISMKPTLTKEDRNNMTGMMGNQGAITISQMIDLSFDVELATSGAVGVAPAYRSLLLACGLEETVDVDEVIYTPIDEAFVSASFWWRNSGLEYTVTGARGSVKFSLDSEKIPKLSFTFKGLYNDPTANNAKAVADFSAFKNPIGVMKATATTQFMGSVVEMKTLSIDVANQVEYFNYTSLETVEVVGRKSSLSINFKTYQEQYVDLMQRIKNNEYGAFNFALGSTAGSMIAIDVPNLQVKTSPDLSYDKEVAHLSVEAAIVPTARNNDFVLTYR